MIDDCFLYAVRKQKKYLQAYANRKASWCYFPYNAPLFTTKDMAENFASITNGKVVSVEIVIRKVDDQWVRTKTDI
jgi:hypothetical protein